MANAQIQKIIKDLSSTNDKLKILALMYVPRIKDQKLFDTEEMGKLIELVNQHSNSENTDISFLAKKAKNYLGTYAPAAAKSSESDAAVKAVAEPSSPWSGLNPIDIQKRLNTMKPGTGDVKAIADLLEHENSRVIASAVEAIERLASDDQVTQFLSPYLNHENNRVRANILKAIGKIEPTKIHSALSEMLQSPKIAMRESAVWAVTQLEPSTFLKSALLKRLHDPYRDIRLRAIEALSNYPQPDVITQMRRLSNDLDQDIRDRANQVMQDLTHRLKPDETQTQYSSQEAIDEEAYDEFIDEDPGYIAIDSAEKESIAIEEDYLDEDLKPGESSAQDPTKSSVQDKQSAKVDTELFQNITPFEQFERFSDGSTLPEVQEIEKRLQSLSHKASLQRKIEEWDPSETFSPITREKPLEESSKKPDAIQPATPEPTSVPTTELLRQPIPEPASKTLEALDQKVHRQIQMLLRNVGQEAYSLCREYNPGNRHVERAYELVLRAQSRLHRFQSTEPTSSEELYRMRELQDRLRESFVVLGKTAMKEAKRTEFTLHGIEDHQRKLRQLLDSVSGSK